MGDSVIGLRNTSKFRIDDDNNPRGRKVEVDR